MEKCLNYCSHQIQCKLEVVFCLILKAAVLKALDATLYLHFQRQLATMERKLLTRYVRFGGLMGVNTRVIVCWIQACAFLPVSSVIKSRQMMSQTVVA